MADKKKVYDDLKFINLYRNNYRIKIFDRYEKKAKAQELHIFIFILKSMKRTKHLIKIYLNFGACKKIAQSLKPSRLKKFIFH